MTDPDCRNGYGVCLDGEPIHGHAMRRLNIQEIVEHIAGPCGRLQQRGTGQALQCQTLESDDLNVFGASPVHRDRVGRLLV
jgi:hypothetical protein